MAVTADRWRDRAACIGSSPEMWMVEGDGQTAIETIDRCLDICSACPVRAECLADDLAYANRNGRVHIVGTRGGMAQAQRVKAFAATCGRKIWTARGERLPSRAPAEIAHGTATGYRLERSRGLPSCDACRAANTAYSAARKRQAEVA